MTFACPVELNKTRAQIKMWAVVVAKLVGPSLPIPEVRGWNPVIGKH